jgi:hypothetical protein
MALADHPRESAPSLRGQCLFPGKRLQGFTNNLNLHLPGTCSLQVKFSGLLRLYPTPCVIDTICPFLFFRSTHNLENSGANFQDLSHFLEEKHYCLKFGPRFTHGSRRH